MSVPRLHVLFFFAFLLIPSFVTLSYALPSPQFGRPRLSVMEVVGADTDGGSLVESPAPVVSAITESLASLSVSAPSLALETPAVLPVEPSTRSVSPTTLTTSVTLVQTVTPPTPTGFTNNAHRLSLPLMAYAYTLLFACFLSYHAL